MVANGPNLPQPGRNKAFLFSNGHFNSNFRNTSFLEGCKCILREDFSTISTLYRINSHLRAQPCDVYYTIELNYIGAVNISRFLFGAAAFGLDIAKKIHIFNWPKQTALSNLFIVCMQLQKHLQKDFSSARTAFGIVYLFVPTSKRSMHRLLLALRS